MSERNWSKHISAARTPVITAVPIILVNIVAVLGQFGYLRDHLHWPVIGVAIFAAAIESVALYLAYMAHKALLSMDSSMRLRLGAISFGLLAGFMNASHYTRHGHVTFVSVATGIMSASSPFLWGIYSRRQSRDALMERGLIEPGAVRLGSVRWLMYPVKSFQVFRLAAWNGVREPAQAITEWEDTQEITDAVIVTEPVTPAVTPAEDSVTPDMTIDSRISNAQAIGMAFDALGRDTDVATVTEWLAARGKSVAPAYIRQVRSRNRKRDSVTSRDNVRALPTGTYQDK